MALPYLQERRLEDFHIHAGPLNSQIGIIMDRGVDSCGVSSIVAERTRSACSSWERVYRQVLPFVQGACWPENGNVQERDLLLPKFRYRSDRPLVKIVQKILWIDHFVVYVGLTCPEKDANLM
jgi:hypothetical protein